MLLPLLMNIQWVPQSFGAHDDGGAEALARKTVANRKKAEAELAEIQRKALEATQKQVEIAAKRTESTPKALKVESEIRAKVTPNFSVLDNVSNHIKTPDQISDDFDMELVMAMLLID
jgi:hypothetical protein